MLDLKIDQLRLNVEGAAGHEYRVRPIVSRAMALLPDRLERRLGKQLPAPGNLGALQVPPLRLDLRAAGDEQAAQALADAIVEALALKLAV
jgi:hypothetical protein